VNSFGRVVRKETADSSAALWNDIQKEKQRQQHGED
jgi:hypothetical protein